MAYPNTTLGWSQAKQAGDTAEMNRIQKALYNTQVAIYGMPDRKPAVQPNGSATQVTTETAQPSFDTEGRIKALFGTMEAGNNAGAQELLDLANGDYNLVAKWLENEYTLATGKDDQARKDFILSVANDLESKIGTIAYDYNTGTYRTKEDMGIQSGQVTSDRSLALKRLAEDDATLNKQLKFQSEQERTAQNESLNARGLMSGTRDTTQGIAQKDIGSLEQNIQDRFDALQRQTQRSGEDTNTSADRSLASINLTGNRTLEDLTTGARRGMQGASDTYMSSLERAQQQKRAREIEIEQQRKRANDQAMLLASQQAQREAENYYAG